MKTLIYAGPSLPNRRDIIEADEILLPPIKQSDLITDLKRYPDTQQVVIIDGEFNQALSVWHKEILYAMAMPQIMRVIGASSMGALRAVELCPYGMVGCGQIFEWYLRGVTENEAEVALSYDPDSYTPLTVPLCDIRAGIRHYQVEFPDNGKLNATCANFFANVAKIDFSCRTRRVLDQAWETIGGNEFGISFPEVEQKRIDAVEAIALSRDHKNIPAIDKAKCMSSLNVVVFNAQLERERRIEVDGHSFDMMEVDSYIAFHAVDAREIFNRAANRALALVLADMMDVRIGEEDYHQEMVRWHRRMGVAVGADLTEILKRNAMDFQELSFLIQEEARLRKLRNSYRTTQLYRYFTQTVVDYLRSEDAFDYWAKEAAAFNKKISGVDLVVDPELNIPDLLSKYLDKQGITPDTELYEYMGELGQGEMTGFYEPLVRAYLAEQKDSNG